MKIFIKDKKRLPGEKQYFIHDFVDDMKGEGFTALPEKTVTDRLKIGGVVRHLTLGCSAMKHQFVTPREAVLVAARGEDLLYHVWPYEWNYEIVPMLWDVWPSAWGNIDKAIRKLKIRTMLVTVRSFAEQLKEKYGIHAIWVPEGIRAGLYPAGPDLKDRKYSVFELGRHHQQYHPMLMEMINNHELTDWVDTGREKQKFISQDVFQEALLQAKVVTNFPRKDTNPEETGDIDTLTQRYWECMLSKTLMIGRAPQELLDFVGYNPLIEVDWNHPKEQLREILDHIADYQDLVDRNFAVAREKASWSARFLYIKEQLEKLGYNI